MEKLRAEIDALPANNQSKKVSAALKKAEKMIENADKVAKKKAEDVSLENAKLELKVNKLNEELVEQKARVNTAVSNAKMMLSEQKKAHDVEIMKVKADCEEQIVKARSPTVSIPTLAELVGFDSSEIKSLATAAVDDCAPARRVLHKLGCVKKSHISALKIEKSEQLKPYLKVLSIPDQSDLEKLVAEAAAATGDSKVAEEVKAAFEAFGFESGRDIIQAKVSALFSLVSARPPFVMLELTPADFVVAKSSRCRGDAFLTALGLAGLLTRNEVGVSVTVAVYFQCLSVSAWIVYLCYSRVLVFFPLFAPALYGIASSFS